MNSIEKKDTQWMDPTTVAFAAHDNQRGRRKKCPVLCEKPTTKTPDPPP
jgi:hypothetical protein